MNNTRDVVEATAIDLAQKIHARLASIERFTGKSYSLVRGDILEQAVFMVQRLHERIYGHPADRSDEYARVVCEVLFGVGNHPAAEFWSTPLGADVAWTIGYPVDGEIPAWAAAAVLRCSRQRLWQRFDKPFTAATIRTQVRSSARWREATATVAAEG